MAEREANQRAGLRFAAGAAGLAVLAAGATAMIARLRGPARSDDRHPYVEGETSGRGEPVGGPDRASRESGYEHEDANARRLVEIMAVSLAIMIVSVVGVFFMFAHFDRSFQAQNKALTAVQRAPIVPPLPHLQAAPYRDIDAVLMEQTRRLTTYGWNGPEHRDAHVPIARAIDQVIGKPLDGPAQADASGPPGSTRPQPATPDLDAALPQDKPANRVQGEGRPGAVAPSLPPDRRDAKP